MFQYYSAECRENEPTKMQLKERSQCRSILEARITTWIWYNGTNRRRLSHSLLFPVLVVSREFIISNGLAYVTLERHCVRAYEKPYGKDESIVSEIARKFIRIE